MPNASAALVQVACPPDSGASAHNGVAPSEKVTLPVGTGLPVVGVTVAVKITGCPAVDGFAELVNTVPAGAALTVSVVVPLLVAKLVVAV